jgi:hypothetical protein
MKKLLHVSLFLILFQLAIGLNYAVVKAEAASQWSLDARVPGYLDDTFTPFLVLDSHQTVHALTSQWINDGKRRLAVVHRTWSLSGGWTKPVDIILAPTKNAKILGVFIDSSETMHIIFMTYENDNPTVYYSSAPVAEANSAKAWSEHEVVGPLPSLESAAIIGDDQGNLFIIYCGIKDGSGVYFVKSVPEGTGWSDPTPIFLTYETDLYPFSLRMVMGPDRQIRATWNVVDFFGVDQGLYFANYSIPDSQWSNPVELDLRTEGGNYFGPSFPAIVDKGDEIVIMYNDGNPFSGIPVDLGRPVQIVRTSRDGGENWSSPAGPFPSHQGRSGEHAMVLDSNGAPHALFTQRIESQGENGEYLVVGGIWHSAFQNGIWASPDRIVTTYAPHDVRAIISQGNVLLAVWREDPGAQQTHGVWFSYKILDSPALPVVSPTPMPASGTPISTFTPTQFLIPVAETPSINLNNIPPSFVSSPAGPLIISIVPVILILVGIVVMYQYYHNRNN